MINGKYCITLITMMLIVYDVIGKHLDECKQTDMMWLEFSKAFDSVDHNMLADPDGSFDAVVAQNSEVLGSNPGRFGYLSSGLCIYIAPNC